MTVNQQYLNEYFGNIWHKHSDPCVKQNKSGLELLTKISPDEWIIDVGCGRNPFKGKIQNLIGIDPAFDTADVKCTIDEYQTIQRFDVALCLGSINFGSVEDIERQIAKVVSLLNPDARIYWRCNPGKNDHPDAGCQDITFYPWSFEEHVRLSAKFGFTLVECCWEQEGRRIYAEWTRTV
jgi:hypothetical protein